MCDQTRTRQIPKTRRERRPRIVHRYRREPRYAPWATYKTWEWVATARAEASGADASPTWPDAGAIVAARPDDAGAAPPKSGDRREVRSETLAATITTDDGASRAYVPSDEADLARLTPGSTHRVKVEAGRITVLD
jgi:hypothetical protein